MLVVSAIFIGLLTLRSVHALEPVAFEEWCLVCGPLGAVDSLLNVLLFVPLGAAAWLSGARSRTAIALALGLTLFVESMQGLVLTGRDASIGDVLANATGGWIGFLIASHWRRLLAPSRGNARALAIGACSAWLAVIVVTAVLFQRSLPAEPLWTAPSPTLRAYARFQGRVLAASLGSEPVEGPRYLTAGSRDALQQLPIHMDARITVGPLRETFAPVIGVFRDTLFAAALGQEGRDAVFRVRLRASNALLRSPGLRIRDVFPDVPAAAEAAAGRRMHVSSTDFSRIGDTLRLVAIADRDALMLRVEGRGGVLEERAPLQPVAAWRLIYPFAGSVDRWLDAITALWAFAWLLAIAFWGTAAGRLVMMSTTTVAVLGGLGLVPFVMGYGVAAVTAWIGAGTGVVLGTVLGAVVMRRALRDAA